MQGIDSSWIHRWLAMMASQNVRDEERWVDQQQQSRWQPTRRQVLWAVGIAAKEATQSLLGGEAEDEATQSTTRGRRWLIAGRREEHRGGPKLDSPNLEEANLQGANLTKANLPGANLKGANLRGAKLGDVLSEDDAVSLAVALAAGGGGANLLGADLEGANLEETQGQAALSGANLKGASLCAAVLSWAHIAGADLRGAILRGAILRNAGLRDADLVGTDLTGADLTGADLTGADLTGARGVTEDQLAQARRLEGATMPNGQKYEEWLKSKDRE